MSTDLFPLAATTSGPIVDAGEKIGGARKDLWAGRGLSVSDLDAMTGAEQAQHVLKANVWKPDYAALIEAGTEPIAAAITKVVYDHIPTKPADDTPAARRAFVQALETIRGALSQERTEASVLTAWRAVSKHLEYRLIARLQRQRFTLKNRAQNLLAQGFPAIEPWRRLFTLEHEDWRREPLWIVRRGHRLIGTYASEELAISAAKHAYNTRTTAERPRDPERPHLDHIERRGPDVRQGRDIDSHDFLQLGFRGVEYGNWATQDERQKIVNHAYEALHDLANVLGVPPRALSLDGTLGLAFAARGSGPFSAHYEPARRVINLTKLRGAGALAHEWGHALDHYFGELGRANAYQGLPGNVSGWRDKPATHKLSSGELLDSSTRRRLRPEIAAAWNEVLLSLFRQPPSTAALQTQREAQMARLERDRDGWVRELRRVLDQEGGPSRKRAIGRRAEQIESTIRELNARIGYVTDMLREPDKYRAPRTPTEYYDAAKQLSGASGADGYWARPTELLARAFEAYVTDKLHAADRVSQYLVHGAEAERFAGGYKGNPYPAAAERQRLAGAFDGLFAEVKTRETARGLALYRVDDVPVHARTWVSPRGRELTEQEMETRAVGTGLLLGEHDAVAIAAHELAPLVAPGAVFVPVPNAQGSTVANRALAQALADRSSGEVLELLRRVRDPLSAVHLTALASAPAGRTLYIVNASDSGLALTAARQALGGGTGLVFAVHHEPLTLEHVRAALGPNVPLIQSGDSFFATLRNGVTIRVQHDATIDFDRGVFRASYHRDPRSSEAPLGTYTRIGPEAVIRLAQAGNSRQTLDHELFHAAMDLVLLPAERRAVLHRYGSEEAAAEAYAHWRPAQEPKGPFAKIQAFFQRFVDHFTPRPERVFEDLRAGALWDRATHARGHHAQFLRFRAGDVTQPGLDMAAALAMPEPGGRDR